MCAFNTTSQEQTSKGSGDELGNARIGLGGDRAWWAKCSNVAGLAVGQRNFLKWLNLQLDVIQMVWKEVLVFPQFKSFSILEPLDWKDCG
jgi:hypothetical protein